MAKISEKYEAVYILDSRLGEEETDALVKKFTNLISENGTLAGEPDLWGKRRLAYPINDLNEGYYVLTNFESAPDFPKELDRQFKISDGVIRSLITVREG